MSPSECSQSCQAVPEKFIARQPILDVNQEVCAYELLFRSGVENYFSHSDGDQATTQLIVNSMLLFGMEAVTGRAQAFINFTRSILLDGSASLLPREKVVVEVLEDINPDRQVLEACAKLKKEGFTLALDDYVGQEQFVHLLPIVDVVKIDFLGMPENQRARLAETLAPSGVRLLAEKIETRQDFQQARRLGYSLFQGYFFFEPVIIRRRDIPSNKVRLLQVLKELNRPDLDLKDLARLISSDVSMTFKLLRYINSAAFSLLAEVKSIEQALNLLGKIEIRKWATLITMSGLCQGKPTELMATSVVRAKLAESLAVAMGLRDRAPDYFIMGLFSLLDTLFGRPLPEMLQELPLSVEVKDALLGKDNQGRKVLDLIRGVEQGDWNQISHLAEELGLDEPGLTAMYLDAVQESRELTGMAA